MSKHVVHTVTAVLLKVKRIYIEKQTLCSVLALGSLSYFYEGGRCVHLPL